MQTVNYSCRRWVILMQGVLFIVCGNPATARKQSFAANIAFMVIMILLEAYNQRPAEAAEPTSQFYITPYEDLWALNYAMKF